MNNIPFVPILAGVAATFAAIAAVFSAIAASQAIAALDSKKKRN